jgi:hypothetical protein
MSMFRRIRFGVLVIGLFSLLAWAGKNFVMPQAKPAVTYPAHDAHNDEKVIIALDPYDTSDKANIFNVKYNEVGFMPIFFVITNDGDEPISLNAMKAQLVTHNRTKISPADEDDLYRRLAHPTQSTSPLPLPYPRTKIKGRLDSKTQEELQNSRFAARAVEPHSTQSGFLFFDVSDISNPLSGANFYLAGVHDSKGNELMYFEIPLEKYVNAPK